MPASRSAKTGFNPYIPPGARDSARTRTYLDKQETARLDGSPRRVTHPPGCNSDQATRASSDLWEAIDPGIKGEKDLKDVVKGSHERPPNAQRGGNGARGKSTDGDRNRQQPMNNEDGKVLGTIQPAPRESPSSETDSSVSPVISNPPLKGVDRRSTELHVIGKDRGGNLDAGCSPNHNSPRNDTIEHELIQGQENPSIFATKEEMMGADSSRKGGGRRASRQAWAQYVPPGRRRTSCAEVPGFPKDHETISPPHGISLEAPRSSAAGSPRESTESCGKFRRESEEIQALSSSHVNPDGRGNYETENDNMDFKSVESSLPSYSVESDDIQDAPAPNTAGVRAETGNPSQQITAQEGTEMGRRQCPAFSTTNRAVSSPSSGSTGEGQPGALPDSVQRKSLEMTSHLESHDGNAGCEPGTGASDQTSDDRKSNPSQVYRGDGAQVVGDWASPVSGGHGDLRKTCAAEEDAESPRDRWSDDAAPHLTAPLAPAVAVATTHDPSTAASVSMQEGGDHVPSSKTARVTEGISPAVSHEDRTVPSKSPTHTKGSPYIPPGRRQMAQALSAVDTAATREAEDMGRLWHPMPARKPVRVSYNPQSAHEESSSPRRAPSRVADVVAGGLSAYGANISEYSENMSRAQVEECTVLVTNFPSALPPGQRESLLQPLTSLGALIVWSGSDEALATFATRSLARQAIANRAHRSSTLILEMLSEAREDKRRGVMRVELAKPGRPPSDASSASRLISGALGIRRPREEREKSSTRSRAQGQRAPARKNGSRRGATAQEPSESTDSWDL